MAGPDIQKLYYTIGEVSELLGLDAHVLRYWEGEFEELKPRKNRAGRRAYTQDDIDVLRRIQHLLKEEKYTLEGARQVLQRAATDEEAFRQQLTELRAFLAELRGRL